MIIKKRYLTVIDKNPTQSGHHTQKGSFDDIGHAVKLANSLAERGAESVLVVSKAVGYDAYNSWMLHYHTSHDPTDEEQGYSVVCPVDIKGELMAL